MTATIDSQRLVTHKEMGGLYEDLGQAKPAGAMRQAGFYPVHVYRNVDSGQLYYRAKDDFNMRMKKVNTGSAPCRRASDSLHWNAEDALPPVDCPLLILVDNQTVRAQRPRFAQSRGDDLEYHLADGTVLTGRFPWTYP